MDYSTIDVLIIDDDPTTRRIITKLTKEIGFNDIAEAENGEIAFQMIQENDYGLVLSDWDMPVMNGMELLIKIRSDEKLSEMPFIMITANDNKDSIIEAAKAKVNQYIVKPFTAQSLRDKIEKVMLSV